MSVIDFRGRRPVEMTETEKLVAGEEDCIRKLVAKLKRMFPWKEPNDIAQSVRLGYVEAAEANDPTKGSFSRYAYTRVMHRTIGLFADEAQHFQFFFARELVTTTDLEGNLNDPWASDEEIFQTLRSICDEGSFRMFMGASFETWRWQGEEGLLDHLSRLRAFDALKKSFTSLSDDDWRLYELYFIDCRTWGEVAEVFGISERQIQRRADDVHKKLKRELRTRGITQAPPEAP